MALQGYRERRWWKYYDTVDCAKALHTTRVFGSENVGNRARTNLDAANMIVMDCTFVIQSLYAICPIDERIADCHVQFVIGNRPMLPAVTLREWLMGIQPRRPLIIPVRQSFYAQLDWFKNKPHVDDGPFDVALHFEGLLTRDVS